MKATEQYFPVVLFIMLYKVVLTSESVDEILKCDHSNESYWAVLSCGAVDYAVQGGFNFWDCGWNPKVWPFKWKLLSSTFPWCCLFFNISKNEIEGLFWFYLWLLGVQGFNWVSTSSKWQSVSLVQVLQSTWKHSEFLSCGLFCSIQHSVLLKTQEQGQWFV